MGCDSYILDCNVAGGPPEPGAANGKQIKTQGEPVSDTIPDIGALPSTFPRLLSGFQVGMLQHPSLKASALRNSGRVHYSSPFALTTNLQGQLG